VTALKDLSPDDHVFLLETDRQTWIAIRGVDEAGNATQFRHDTTLNAITCNWVTQISFKPLLVLVAIEKASFSHQLLQQSEVFALNLLDREQSHLARRMAAPHRHNPHKLAGVTYHPGQTGVPLLDDALAWLECEIKQTVETEGDHTLFIGEVIDGGVSRRAEPLTLLASGLRYK
jgi:flavin reductase (DIM6/NTAB) family NADH-FMN oxidoreductase RutF